MSSTKEESPPSNANDGCVGPSSQEAGKNSNCNGCPNQSACASGTFNSPAALAKEEQEKLSLQRAFRNVSHVVLVLSGKGGVGKSTLSSQISHTLASRGYAVGLLDVDLCGPSAPRMVGAAHAGAVVHKSGSGAWTPYYATPNLAVMSISFLLQDHDAAVVWRGPRKNALIQQFLTETDWDGETGGLDYLIVDTPPGTSDEHISTVQFLQKAGAVSGAIVVTTPEEVSMADVRKELSFCRKTNVNVLGLVENMASYETRLQDLTFLNKDDGTDATAAVLEKIKAACPEVLETLVSADIFPASGAGPAGMAQRYGIDYWGSMPLDVGLLKACEDGVCFVDQVGDDNAGGSSGSGGGSGCTAAKVLNDIVDRLVASLPVEEAEQDDEKEAG